MLCTTHHPHMSAWWWWACGAGGHSSVHVFAEEGLRNFFDIIAIKYEKGAKSSLYRALPDITSNRRYIESPPCQQISSSLYRLFRYSAPRYIGPPTAYNMANRTCIEGWDYSEPDIITGYGQQAGCYYHFRHGYHYITILRTSIITMTRMEGEKV